MFKSLNIQFIFYFLFFSYIPLLFFSILGYHLNKRLITNIHQSYINKINFATGNRIYDLFELKKQLGQIYFQLISENIDTSTQNSSVLSNPFLIVKDNEIVSKQHINPAVQAYLVKSLENKEYKLVVVPPDQLYLKEMLNDENSIFINIPLEELQDKIRPGRESEINNLIVSRTGRFIVSTEGIEFFKKSNDELIRQDLFRSGNTTTGHDEFISDFQIVSGLFLYSVKGTTGIFKELETFLVEIIIANIFIGLFMFLIALFFSRRITTPIRSLVSAVHKISSGDMSHPITIKSNDEIKILADEFEQMRQKLKESYTDLEAKIEERTEALRDAQFQISHQEKMASLGLLAAGVAHEIGNPLTSISSMAQIIKRKVKDQNFIEYLNTILKNIDRIRKIVRELVDFARPSSYEAGETNINELIRNAIGIVKYDRRAKSINIDLELENNLPSLYLVEDQLMQVFINILINAVDALTDERNRIIIRSFRRETDVIVQFEDSGIGIEPEHLTKIFEPFFTTKKVGKGTGLGLSVSYGIIKNLNGKIEVESQPGTGSIFTITLPRSARRS